MGTLLSDNPAPTQRPASITVGNKTLYVVKARGMGELISPKQKRVIEILCGYQGLNPTNEAMQIFKCNHTELTRAAASAFITYLKAKAIER